MSTEGDRWSGAALGFVVGAIGLWAADRGVVTENGDFGFAVAVAVAMAVAAGTYRLLPGPALALAWAASVVQVVAGMEVSVPQLATILVAYGTARYGQAVTLWCSGLSVPVGSAIALVYFQRYGGGEVTREVFALVPGQVTSMTTAVLLVLVLLGTPWALGLVLRLRAQSRIAREERERAELDAVRAKEVAEVRAEQARLARDVHDVVGHSLTVILAQADSAEFMADDDIDRIRAALSNISTSARRSLGDVRQVLSSTNDPADAPRSVGDLDSLLEGVRAAGNDVRARVDGTPRPLPPELDVVAFRVLQEMLTNALKHGRRGAPIEVLREWGAAHLRIEVRNAVPEEVRAASLEGLGEPGMRRRLESVGGRLHLRSDPTPGVGEVFTATAWVPLRAAGSSR